MPKTPDQLRNDTARVFYDQTPARPHYGLEEAMGVVASFDDPPNVMDECFGGALRGGMYRNELVRCVTESFAYAHSILEVLRREPEAALELLTNDQEPRPSQPRPVVKTPEEGSAVARELLTKYIPQYGNSAQIAALTLALDAGARVLCVDAMGELAFLVFRPVPPNVEEALNALAQVPRPFPFGPGTRYVTDNPNWQSTPYWDTDLCLRE